MAARGSDARGEPARGGADDAREGRRDRGPAVQSVPCRWPQGRQPHGGGADVPLPAETIPGRKSRRGFRGGDRDGAPGDAPVRFHARRDRCAAGLHRQSRRELSVGVLGVAIEDRDPALGRLDQNLVAAANRVGGTALLETIHHGHLGEGRALGQNGVGAIEQDRLGREAALAHLPEHPGGSHAALGGHQNEDLVDVALAGELVLGPGEHALDAVEVVAGREIVVGDESRALHVRTDARVAFENEGHQRILPAQALATQFSMLASDGL